MDEQFINELIFISIIWLVSATITAFVSKKKDKSFLYGFFIGCVFGPLGIVLFLLFPKSNKNKYVYHENDRVDSRLRYYKLKEEFEEYKKKKEEGNK